MLFKNKFLYPRSFVHFELKTFLNVYILWLTSRLGSSQKKITKSMFSVYLLNNLSIKNKYMWKTAQFYKVLNSCHMNNKKKEFNKIITNIQKKMIGILIRFKKKIRLRGIGYKFILNKNLLTIRIGFTHQFILLMSSLLYARLNKKQTKLLLKYHDINKLTLLLSSLQNIQKPNVYTGKGIRYNLKKFIIKEGKKKKF